MLSWSERLTSPGRSHNCRERHNKVQAINVYTEDRRISITLILKDICGLYNRRPGSFSLAPASIQDDGWRSHLFGSSTVVGRVHGGGGRDASFFLSLSLL